MKWEMMISSTGLGLGFVVGVCGLMRMTRDATKMERLGLIFWTVGCATSLLEWVWFDLCYRWPEIFAAPTTLFGDQILHMGIAVLSVDWIIRRIHEAKLTGSFMR